MIARVVTIVGEIHEIYRHLYVFVWLCLEDCDFYFKILLSH